MSARLMSQTVAQLKVGLNELPDPYIAEMGVMTVDARGRISEITPAVGGLLRVKASAFVHRPLADLMARVCNESDVIEQILEAVQQALLAWKVSAFELQLHRGETPAEFLKLHVSALRSPRNGGSAAALVFQDITAYRQVGLFGLAREDARRYTEARELATRLEQQKEKYRLESIHDGLTGLYNFARFQVLLAEEVSRARRYGHPLALLMIDVDDFKNYNDSHGHPAGNRALRHLAAILQRTSRQTDQVARYGGEEFAAILPETDMRGALGMAERLRRSVERESHNNLVFRQPITVSVGVASYPDDVDCSQETILQRDLVLRADERLYQAKAAGKNGVYGAPEVTTTAGQAASSTLRLRRATRLRPP
ncbi:MAG: GGDEF domain-containing protein [Anaerolineae bacterium]